MFLQKLTTYFANSKISPLIRATDHFFYEASDKTSSKGPHIRDIADVKRWMILVVVALLPCILWTIWNTGLQKIIYTSNDVTFVKAYLLASKSFFGYFEFIIHDQLYISIIKTGLLAVVPIILISYLVGGLWEVFFACVRGHDIAEGFLVTGLLYPLILPSTIPYWMVAVGVSAGVVLSKELFGGTGMNIINPALASRCFLFFTFPNKMTGDIWAGTNPIIVKNNVEQMKNNIDGYTQATPLSTFNVNNDIKRIHVDTIASQTYGCDVDTHAVIDSHLHHWQELHGLNHFSGDQVQQFVTMPLDQGGLGLPVDSYQAATDFAQLQYGLENHTDGNFFFGNILGSIGETSTLACLIGAFWLLYWGIASWRIMAAIGLGSFITALIFQYGSRLIGIDGGAWNPARFAFPAYKHLLLGGLAFGLVFMATDPVTSPGMTRAKWFYGLLIGAIVIGIRTINPAYPEGVMIAILLGNVCAPLMDYYTVRRYRKKYHVQRT